MVRRDLRELAPARFYIGAVEVLDLPRLDRIYAGALSAVVLLLVEGIDALVGRAEGSDTILLDNARGGRIPTIQGLETQPTDVPHQGIQGLPRDLDLG